LLKQGKVEKATANYVAALGPSLRSTGLVATLAIYASDDAGRGEAAKLPVLKLVTAVLADDEIALLADAKERTALRGAKTMFHWAIKQKPPQFARIQRQLETAAAAVKVAIRTYKIPKS